MKAALGSVVALLLALGLTVALFPPEAPVQPAAVVEEGPGFARADSGSILAEGLAAPVWRPGHAWTVHFLPSGFTCALVVVAADAGGARQGSACRGAEGLATEDAVFDYAFMGRFGPGLEGLREDEPPVVFYDWPLTDGKRWATEWFGVELEVVATYDEDVSGPHGDEPGFRLAMEMDGETVVEYDYVPSIGWWSILEVEGGFRMEVDAFDPAWRGEASVAQAEERLALDGNTGFRFPRTFTVPPDDDLLLLTERNEGSTLQGLILLDPDNDVAYNEVTPPLVGSQRFRMTYLEPKPGDWTAAPLQVGGRGALTTVHGVRFEAFTL